MDKVIVEYELVPKGGDKVIATVADITESLDKSKQAADAVFSEKQIDETTEKLKKFNTEVEKTSTGFSSAKGELNALTKQITSGQLQGNDLKVAIKRAAELKDKIGDVRSEIGKLSSDTRIFDTFVEGGRAVAAAFSVAQGAAALFGDENKDLQKSILKVQGALALLTGAQELANIVTTKGGIATQAYGVALKVVDGIAKVTGLSIAASMAVATAGVTLLIAGAVALYNAFSSSTNASEEFEAQEAKRFEERKKRQDEVDKTISDLRKERVNQYTKELDEFDRQQDARRKEGYLKLQNSNQLELQLLKDKLKESEFLLQRFEGVKEYLDKESGAEYKKTLEDRVLDTKVALKKIEFAIEQSSNKPITNVPVLKPDLLTIEPTKIEITKVPDVAVEIPVKYKSVFDEFATDEDKQRLKDKYFEFASSAASSIQSISASIFQAETTALMNEKQRQLELVGDNTKARQAIEKRYAIKQAEIRRKQAIADKAFAIVQIGIATATAIQKQLASSGNYVIAAPFIALIAATAGLQVAAVAAQPLPEIPKFAKGVIGFKGKGTQTSDENLVMISNNESIMTGKATDKYHDELKAAQNLELESLIYHKYLLPALKQVGIADKESSTYDDGLLRKTIRRGQDNDRANSEYIVNGIARAIKDNTYIQKTYYA